MDGITRPAPTPIDPLLINLVDGLVSLEPSLEINVGESARPDRKTPLCRGVLSKNDISAEEY